jgi:acyl dehydratase
MIDLDLNLAHTDDGKGSYSPTKETIAHGGPRSLGW